MAEPGQMTAMRRGGRYGFTRHRGSLNDRRTRRISYRCTRRQRVIDSRAYGAIMSVAAHERPPLSGAA
jgi:hypothetical protein